MKPFDEVQTIELEIQQFWAAVMLDGDLVNDRNTKLHVQFRIENLAYQLQAVHKTAAQTLQNDREVASWPTSRWDNFLVSVGLRKYAKFTRLKFTEMLTFPSIQLPEPLRDKMRIHTYQALASL